MSNRLLLQGPASVWPSFLQPPPPRSTWAAIRAHWRRYRSRQRIAALDAHMLRDIGVTYAEAEAEANKPFWRD
jgi:uncharacterized protein YjiS (DUF1127 family)